MLEGWDSGYYRKFLCGASQLVITGVINSFTCHLFIPMNGAHFGSGRTPVTFNLL